VSERSVEQRLYDEGHAFDFFQAVRLLQRLQPDRVGAGRGGPPAREVVRFRALPSLNFPPSSVYEIRAATPEQPVPAMLVSFLGLTGPSGVLPRHYTEQILRQERERKGEERRALRDWFDLFNHRVIGLFYRAWEKYRFWISHERGEPGRGEPDLFTHALYCLVGMGTAGLHDRLRVEAVERGGERRRLLARIDDRSLIHYAGLLAQRKRNAAGLEALLEDYFGVPARVQQFVGQWLQLEPTSQSCLGVEGGNSELGVNSVAGERVWDVQGKIRVRLGPLSYDRFLDFLPDQAPEPEHKAFFLLVHLVRLYAGAQLDFDVQVVLRAEAVPECQLSEEGPGARLGWNTWLVSQQPALDADDALFVGEDIVRVSE
jgi:type VI secretion system protein ImpH